MYGWGLCRFDARTIRIQTQETVRFTQVWCFCEKDSDARVVGEVCAGLMLLKEGFRRRSGWGLCTLEACVRRIQTQECVRFVQVWCVYEKGSDARVREVCAGLMLVWEGVKRRSLWGLGEFDACMRKIQAQEWVRYVQVWCKHEKDSDAGVAGVCAGLMRVWEGFRRRSGGGLCRFEACMRRIQTQELVRSGRVWCVYEKESGAGVGEVCAGLMQAWEGFRRRSGWGLCRFDSSMRRILTQCRWGLCRFDSSMRRILMQEWVRFVQVWCLYEKDSDAGLGEVCAGLMLEWEGFRRRRLRGLCRFDASMRRIQTQEWGRFVQVWCLYEKDSDAGVCEVWAGLMRVWERFRRRSGWGLCRFDSSMRRILNQE